MSTAVLNETEKSVVESVASTPPTTVDNGVQAGEREAWDAHAYID